MPHPSTSSAYGIWSLNEVRDAVRGENWPTEISWSVDLSNVTYDSVSFSVASQDTSPRSVVFNTSGTKMYLVGDTNNRIYQYSLSTAFDLTTASYDSVNFSVGTQETEPRGMKFNTNGTKMYVIGISSDSIYQYSLSNAFDLSTASYDSVSFSVSAQDGNPSDISFNSTGTKMYVIGYANNLIHQYSLSTAFDLSTASYDSVSFDLSSQTSASIAFSFNNTGSSFYVVGYNEDTVFQYSLSTPFDISTVSYASKSFDFSAQDGFVHQVTFNTDGTKMYLVGSANDSVFQYSTGL